MSVASDQQQTHAKLFQKHNWINTVWSDWTVCVFYAIFYIFLPLFTVFIQLGNDRYIIPHDAEFRCDAAGVDCGIGIVLSPKINLVNPGGTPKTDTSLIAVL